MKKIIALSIAILTFTFSNAQETTKITKKTTKTTKATTPALPKVEGAGMIFVSETIDYGTVAANSDGKREFVFTNNGNKPLIITNAVGSCGCTVPTYSKEPIAPGAKGVIGVKYDTSRAGQPFTKTVTITSNAAGSPSKTLTIKGNVLALEAPKS
ncbi:DUF1573 domain-containing protein [Flavobacterium franklandianum]|uniref:DUF1573 domain-containing protein n=1 Tax=Flavobacterium franklandianum TaxID=2594430 RepID=A0A553CQB5_9FLAO|nr:DUF1573 domain-containing protein [Flavobacterium franklandianum]TRX22736.1 DUF1573 domain-containing protein [Flavobacterium franklandianum]TRX26560.1 DUF1573 domain-containing protein [Flavobacterium franklandianum]